MVVNRLSSVTHALPKKQVGVVLIISLVFLIALTAVAAALMQNSTTDMKMAGASQDKMIASQEAVSSADEIIFNEVNKVNATNAFTSEISEFPIVPNVSAGDTTAEITVANPYNLVTDCPHSRQASSVEVFKCNVLNVEVIRNYGRSGNSTIEVNAGVAQQILNEGN